MTAKAFDIGTAQALLAEVFAPWVRALDLRVQVVEPSGVVLRLPTAPALARVGGILCGQAMMAAADTAMVLAVSAAAGGFRPMTTVQLQTSFMRPIVGRDALVDARVLRLGRTLAFGEITIRGDGEPGPAAHATTTYALL